MSQKYDPLFIEAKVLSNWRKQQEGEIKTNKSLSPSGKQDELEILAREYGTKRSDLDRRVREQLAKDRAAETQKYKGTPKVPSWRDLVKQRAEKDRGEYSLLLTENQQSMTIMESLDALMDATRENTYVRSISGLDDKAFNELVNTAVQNDDRTRLNWLRNHAANRGDSRTPLIIDSHFENVERTPAQEIAKKELERLDLVEKYYEAGMSMAERGVEFADLRGEQSEQAIDRDIRRITDPGLKNTYREMKGNGAATGSVEGTNE